MHLITAEINEITDYVLNHKHELPESFQRNRLTVQQNQVQSIAVKFGKWIVQFIQSFLQAMFLLVLVPFFFIFMLKDHEKFAPFVYGFFTGKQREWVRKTLSDIDNVLRSYIQGQLLISFLLAILLLIGYSIDWSEICIITCDFRTFHEPDSFHWSLDCSRSSDYNCNCIQDPKLVIWVGVITIVAQQIESNLITPNVMGKSLDIHPLTVITVILAAGNICRIPWHYPCNSNLRGR